MIETARERPNSNAQFSAIQALRFLAAFMVIVLHSTFYAAERLDSGFPLYTPGGSGVRLFFVISGFVMIVSTVRLRNAPVGWAVFAMKRAIRIAPMYWIATTIKLAALLSAPAVVLHARGDWTYIVKSYLFLPALNVDGEIAPLLGVGWTLIFEMFFYALFAAAMALRLPPLPSVGAVLAALSLASLLKTDVGPPAAVYADPIVLDFLFGMIAATLILKGRRLPDGLAAVAVAVSLTQLFVPWLVMGVTPLARALVGVFAFLAVYGSASLQPRLAGRIPSSVLFLGAASYCLYLFHPLTAPLAPTLLRKAGWIWPHLSVALSIVIALAAGSAAHLLAERPLTRLAAGAAARRFAFYRGEAGWDRKSRLARDEAAPFEAAARRRGSVGRPG